MSKVLITGIGAVNSIGNNVSEYWNNLIDGQCGIKEITRINTDEHDTCVAAQVSEDFEDLVKSTYKKRQLNVTTKSGRIALVATQEAIEDSGINFDEVNTDKVGVIYGIIDNTFKDTERDNRLNSILKDTPSIIPALISQRYGLHGAAFNISTACASSAYAASIASQMIEAGILDIAIIGGMSNMVCHDMVYGFNQIMALSTNTDPKTACRPFTLNRDGFVIGEGAGTLILESEESAKKRNAKIYCELAGYSMYSEAYNVTSPLADGEGMEKTMRMALEKANISPDKVEYINAHGTSTPLNDKYETMAIKRIFGEDTKIPVSSTKSAIGHTLAAGAALEAIACIKAMQTDTLPPTIHYDTKDPELDLDYIPNVPRGKHIDIALSNSFGFGGQNSTLIFKRYIGE